MNRRNVIGSALLLAMVIISGIGLIAWKYGSIQQQAAASAHQPEPMESVATALAKEVDHRQITTSIGTVLALRSITLRNELPGTVRRVRLTPGQVVETGTVLVALDVSVEEAELRAQEAQAALESMSESMRRKLQFGQKPDTEAIKRARESGNDR